MTNNNFTLDDLRTGDIVTMRNGLQFVVLKGGRRGDIIARLNSTTYSVISLNSFYKDMSYHRDTSLDIVSVEQSHYHSLLSSSYTTSTETIWERPKPKELTVAQIEELLGYPVKIIKD